MFTLSGFGFFLRFINFMLHSRHLTALVIDFFQPIHTLNFYEVSFLISTTPNKNGGHHGVFATFHDLWIEPIIYFKFSSDSIQQKWKWTLLWSSAFGRRSPSRPFQGLLRRKLTYGSFLEISSKMSKQRKIPWMTRRGRGLGSLTRPVIHVTRFRLP